MDDWNEWPIKISDFIYLVLKSRDYVFKMSIFKKLSIVLYRVYTGMHVYVHIKKLGLLAAVVEIGQ